MHVYHQSTCTLLKNNFSSTLAHGRRWSHTVGHGRTSSHRDFAQKLLYTVEHSRTYYRTPSNTVAQNLFLPHTVTHGCTDDRTQSNTVTQTTAHGRTWSHRRLYMVAHSRTKNPQLPEWPTLESPLV